MSGALAMRRHPEDRERFRLLEPYAGKLACAVLRGGGGREATSLPDVRRESHRCLAYSVR